jgi:hypothetical protein
MIAEPVTVATDYLLGAVSAWLAFLLLRSSRKSQKLWGMAFSALALGAFLGGTWHGFLQSDLLWKATLLCVGVASFGMVAGSSFATLAGNALIWLASVKLALFAAWVAWRSEFIVVIADTAIAFAVVLALHLWRFNGWLVAGVLVSVLAALVQASGFALHRHFNHNDLYHVIQTAAMVLLYRGARTLSDARGPTPARTAAAARP